MALTKKAILFFFFSAIVTTSLRAALPPKISDEIKKEIATSGYYISTKEMNGAPWPEYTVVMPLNLSARDAVAIFSQYEEQKQYVPGVLSATVVHQNSPIDQHVAFEMHMPWPLANTHYTTGNKLVRLQQDAYAVQWYFVSSDSTLDNRGQASFIPQADKNLAYLHYQSFIIPKSSFAGLVKSKVKGDLLKTLQSIRLHLEMQAEQGGSPLENARQRLNSLLPK